MSNEMPPLRRFGWTLFRHDPIGDYPALQPLDEPHRRWAYALEAAGFEPRAAGLVRCEAETMTLDPAARGRDGHTVIDLRHALAMKRLGHPAAVARDVARVAMRGGLEDKAAMDQRVSRLVRQVFKG